MSSEHVLPKPDMQSSAQHLYNGNISIRNATTLTTVCVKQMRRWRNRVQDLEVKLPRNVFSLGASKYTQKGRVQVGSEDKIFFNGAD